MRRVGKQHVGVQIALQGHFVADLRARLAQIDRPVQAEDFAVELAHGFQPQTAAFGKHQARDHHAVVAALELGQHPRCVGQAELMKSRIGQHAAPAVENHHSLGTSVDLCVQVGRHRIGVDGQHFVHQIGTLVHHGFDQPVVVRTGAFHHIAGQRPGAA